MSGKSMMFLVDTSTTNCLKLRMIARRYSVLIGEKKQYTGATTF